MSSLFWLNVVFSQVEQVEAYGDHGEKIPLSHNEEDKEITNNVKRCGKVDSVTRSGGSCAKPDYMGRRQYQAWKKG